LLAQLNRELFIRKIDKQDRFIIDTVKLHSVGIDHSKIHKRSGFGIHYCLHPSNCGNRQTVWCFAIKIRKFAA